MPVIILVDAANECLVGHNSHGHDTDSFIINKIQSAFDLFRHQLVDIELFISRIELDIVRRALDSWTTVLWRLSTSLDRMDISMSQDRSLSGRTEEFRYNLGVWRVNLPKLRIEIKATLARLSYIRTSQPAHSAALDVLIPKYEELLELPEALIQRCEKATQGLMAAMSIAESQNTIKQGHEVQKLTELAFFFIPVSFAASYFGMEVEVCVHAATINRSKLREWFRLTII